MSIQKKAVRLAHGSFAKLQDAVVERSLLEQKFQKDLEKANRAINLLMAQVSSALSVAESEDVS